MNQGYRKGLLLVISGPAGVGKGSIVRVLLERNRKMRLSVSATTRAPRPGEIDGVHYFFMDEQRFQKMIDNGEFIEYMKVFNTNFYGTPRDFVLKEIEDGHDVILEIDVQGAMNVRRSFPDAVLVFICPPSMNELKARLVGRGTETPEAIETRFATATDEIAMMNRYDYVVLNDVIDAAATRIENIVSAEKCRASRNSEFIDNLQGGK